MSKGLKKVSGGVFTVNDQCVSCGYCESVCPVGAIHQGDTGFVIDQNACVQCGQCEIECPCSAIDRND